MELFWPCSHIMQHGGSIVCTAGHHTRLVYIYNSQISDSSLKFQRSQYRLLIIDIQHNILFDHLLLQPVYSYYTPTLFTPFAISMLYMHCSYVNIFTVYLHKNRQFSYTLFHSKPRPRHRIKEQFQNTCFS